MSGVVALVTFDGAPVDPALVAGMAAAAPHRGPAGLDRWSGTGAALAFQRHGLATVPGRAGLAVDGGVVCVADARIDNRDELIYALGDPAESLTTATDATILLTAYRRWGTDVASHVIGDFAFAIWDERRRRLIAARDPMGMRSLSYYLRPGRFVATATEVKQLLTLPEVPVRLDEQAVMGDLWATFGHPEASFYEDIRSVAPGQVISVDARRLQKRRFWEPDPAYRIAPHSDTPYAELVRDRFIEAVRTRMRAGSRVGYLLSGGVDSGSVAATGSMLQGRGAVEVDRAVALCFAFDRFPGADERSVSRLITRPYRLSQIDIPVDELGPLAGYPEHGPDRDDPMLGAFQPAIEHALAAAEEAGVTVLLGGDRGDLLFGHAGWDYVSLALARRWRDLAGELREHRLATGDTASAIILDHLVGAVVRRAGRRTPLAWVRQLTHHARGRAQERHPPWLLVAPLERDPRRPVDPSGAQHWGFSRHERRQLIWTPLQLRGMAWSERTYAKFGIGFSDPFSDRRLAELALALPQVAINRPREFSKPLMRAAMEGIVPEDARVRMSKVVPRPLYDHALRVPARPLIRELLRRPRVAAHGWVDAAAWSDHYETWLAGKGALRGDWWWTLSVEIWLRRYW